MDNTKKGLRQAMLQIPDSNGEFRLNRSLTLADFLHFTLKVDATGMLRRRYDC
jgi:hypothetical protein